MRTLLLALLLACCSTALAESFCVAVWYPSSEHPGGADSVMDNSSVIDIVHPFWFTPSADGTILSQAGSNWQEQVEQWRESGLLVMPSVFSTISSYLQEPELTRHIEQILQLAEEHDFDGIDIDYEMFPLETRVRFSGFIERLAAGLHSQGRLLAVTVHAKTDDETAFESARAQDWSRLAAAADLFNLMTYDWTNRNEPPGPVAPVGWTLEVLGYARETTEARTILVGIPFYGYSWTRGRPPARATTWEAADRMISQFRLAPVRDAASQELQLELDVTGLPRQQLTVSDATTLAARLQALPAYSGGVAIWGVGGEDPDNWRVLAEQRPAECGLARP